MKKFIATLALTAAVVPTMASAQNATGTMLELTLGQYFKPIEKSSVVVRMEACHPGDKQVTIATFFDTYGRAATVHTVRVSQGDKFLIPGKGQQEETVSIATVHKITGCTIEVVLGGVYPLRPLNNK